MSKEKTKTPKIKTTGSDVLYRVVMALAAAAVPVAAFFCKLIHFIVESDVFALIAALTGDTDDTGATEDSFSIYYVLRTFGSEIKQAAASTSEDSGVWDSLSAIHAPIIAFLVFFALVLLIAVVLFFFSCFSNNKKVPLCISVAGLASIICMGISFHYLASPIVSGEISLGVFFDSAIISAILPYIASFSLLQLSDAFFVILFLYIGMVVWSGANALISMDGSPKKSKNLVKAA